MLICMVFVFHPVVHELADDLTHISLDDPVEVTRPFNLFLQMSSNTY